MGVTSREPVEIGVGNNDSTPNIHEDVKEVGIRKNVTYADTVRPHTMTST